MKNKILLMMSMFLLVFTLGSIEAVTPFDVPSGINQYVIEFPQLYTAYYNQSFEFNSHVYYNDGTSLLEINPIDNVSCHIDGHDYSGNVTLHLDLDNLYNGNFNVTVPASFFNWIGDGYYTLHCSDALGVVGVTSQSFIVEELPIVEDGKLNLDLTDTMNIIILVILILAILVLIFYKQFLFSGLLTLIIGLIFIFSGMNILLSSFIILIGLGQIFGDK